MSHIKVIETKKFTDITTKRYFQVHSFGGRILNMVLPQIDGMLITNQQEGKTITSYTNNQINHKGECMLPFHLRQVSYKKIVLKLGCENSFPFGVLFGLVQQYIHYSRNKYVPCQSVRKKFTHISLQNGIFKCTLGADGSLMWSYPKLISFMLQIFTKASLLSSFTRN